MGVKVESPDPVLAFDLALFGVFDVKSDESAALHASAQASVAPDEGGSDAEAGEAQEETDAQEQPTEEAESEQDPAATVEPADEDGAQDAEAQAPVAPSADEWVVPGKFRTVEELRRSWEEAHKTLGRLHREYAELKRRGASQAETQAKQTEIVDAEKIAQENRELLREFVKDPRGFKERLKRELQEEQERQRASLEERQRALLDKVNTGIAIVASEHKDFAQVHEAIQQEIANNRALQRLANNLRDDPDSTPEDYAELVRTAYLAVKSRIASEAANAARDQGRKEAQAAAQARQRAQVAAQNTRRDQTTETVEERIKREIREAGGPRGLWRRAISG